MSAQNRPQVQALDANHAVVNITYTPPGGEPQVGDLPDPVSIDATDQMIKQFVAEALRAGIPGIDPVADLDADALGSLVVERIAPHPPYDYARIIVRPKTGFAGGTADDFVPAKPAAVIVKPAASREKVVRFLKLMQRGNNQLDGLFDMMRSTVFAEYAGDPRLERYLATAKLKVQERSAQTIERFVPDYQEAFTEAEIDQLLAFYESEAGKKYQALAPALMTKYYLPYNDDGFRKLFE